MFITYTRFLIINSVVLSLLRQSPNYSTSHPHATCHNLASLEKLNNIVATTVRISESVTGVFNR